MCGEHKPCFGLQNDKRPSCCSKCRTPEMLDFNKKSKKKCVCGRADPSFG